MTRRGGSRSLKTVERTCVIIQALQQLNGAGVTELADYLGFSKGAVHNHLATLHEQQYVMKDGDDYRLSYRFLNHGSYVQNQSTLTNASKPELRRLAEETGEYANLQVEAFGKGFYLAKIPGRKGISREFQAKMFEHPHSLHFSSTGKAILASLPRERTQAILDRDGLAAKTSHTITDREELLQELDEIRNRGYALNDEEEVLGARAVGAPVTNSDGEVLGAISVSGPNSRIKDEFFHDELPGKVVDTANLIEVSLETSETIPPYQP